MEETSPENLEHRPRERLERRGAGALGDHELLALVLGHGGAHRSALEIAKAVLTDAGGVHGLAKTRPSRLAMTAGVGAAQASKIMAAIELGRRTLFIAPRAKLPLQTPVQCGQFLLPRFGAHPVERFGVVMLDSRHRLIRVHLVSEGSLDSTVAIGRDVFREATIEAAAAVVLFHNHPSGDPEPTREDVLLTHRLADAGHTLGIQVVDHLVLADVRYCSMKAMQLL